MGKTVRQALLLLLILGLCFGGLYLRERKRTEGINRVNLEQENAVAVLGTASVKEVNEVLNRVEETAEPTTEGTSEPVTQATEPTPLEPETEPVDELLLWMEEMNAQLDRGWVEERTEEEILSERILFSDTIFFGDSMTQAIPGFELVEWARVNFTRSATIDVLTEKIGEVAEAAPERIIVFTGLNDCNHYYQNMDGYEADYRVFLRALADIVGTDRLYICSVLPPSDWLAASRPDLAASVEFDARLREICASEGVTYVDVNWIVRSDNHADDGIHYNRNFYLVWIRYVERIIRQQESL